MNLADQNSLPGKSKRRAMLLGEVSSRESIRRRTDPNLEIAEDVFSPEVVRALLDEWLVPAIVDSLMQDLRNAALEGEG